MVQINDIKNKLADLLLPSLDLSAFIISIAFILKYVPTHVNIKAIRYITIII